MLAIIVEEAGRGCGSVHPWLNSGKTCAIYTN